MDNLTCNMCGSPDVKREGNYYVCNSCGTKRMLNEDNESLNENKELTESQKAELERLIANIEKDSSFADRILELDPKNCLAFYYKYVAGPGKGTSSLDEWLVLLRESGMSHKEIEDLLLVRYNVYDYNIKTFVKDNSIEFFGLDFTITELERNKEWLDSYCLHILSILGDEYSELTKSWQEYVEKFIDEFKETVKRDREEEQKRDEKEGKNKIIATIFTVIGCLGGASSLALGIFLDGGPYYFWIVLGAIGVIVGFVLGFVYEIFE